MTTMAAHAFRDATTSVRLAKPKAIATFVVVEWTASNDPAKMKRASNRRFSTTRYTNTTGFHMNQTI